jgi:hypothetical protein
VDDAVSKAILSVSSQTCLVINDASMEVNAADTATVLADKISLLGGLAFHITCTTQGDSADATIMLGRYYSDLSTVHVYKGSGAELQDITSQVGLSNQTVDGSLKTIIHYTLVDGGVFDEDNTVNGTIVDPIYIGVTNQESSNGSDSSGTLADTGTDSWGIVSIALVIMISGVTVAMRRLFV